MRREEAEVAVTLNLPYHELVRLFNTVPPTREEQLTRTYGETCTVAQAARILGRSRTTVYSLLDDNKIHRIADGTRVDVRSIARYLEGDKRKGRLRV